MANAPEASAPRGNRTTRFTTTFALDREVVVRETIGGIVRALESGTTVLILMLISDGILPLFLHGGPNYPDPSPPTSLERVAYWLAYGFTLLQALSRPRQFLRAVSRNPFVVGLAALAALSTIWSDDPATSLRLAFAFCMWTLFGCYLASRYDTKELLVHLGIALGILAVLSLATGALLPDYGQESGFNVGAWRGVFTTKNVLGEMMLLSAVVFGSLALGRRRFKAPILLGLILSIALIALSRATAALLIVAVLAITIPVVLTFRRNNAVAALLLCGLLGISTAASVVIVDRDAVLSVLGKEATLTGRTVLWSKVVTHIADRPVLGHGFGAFWDPKAAASERVRAAVGWDAPHSHNGLLDVWLDLGLVGVLLLLAGYLLALRRAWAGLRARFKIDGLWAMSFLVMLFLGNTTESSISQSPLMWAIFVAVACMRSQSDSSSKGRQAFVDGSVRRGAGSVAA